MTVRCRFIQISEIALLSVIVLLIVGAVLGQPVLLGYVESGSMSPTIDRGDGFVVSPIEFQGELEEGDVVVFEAQEVNDGDLTTHRVVDKTDRGYITRGDANAFTDQDNNEPPVKRAQIVAKALQVNGEVVVFPHFGTVIEGIMSVLEQIQRQLASLLGSSSVLGAQGLAYLFFGLTLIWYVVSGWLKNDTRHRDQDVSRDAGTNTRLAVGLFAALLLVGATAAMVGPAGTQKYGVVSAEFDSERPTVIPQGESSDVTYPVDNGGNLPVVAYLEPASEGVAVSPHEARVGPRSVANATVTLQAPPETGYYRRFVVEHRYLAILPLPAIQTLYAVHPWAPIVVIDAVIGVPFYLLGVRLVGTGRIRDRSRACSSRLSTRLRRLVGRLY